MPTASRRTSEQVIVSAGGCSDGRAGRRASVRVRTSERVDGASGRSGEWLDGRTSGRADGRAGGRAGETVAPSGKLC